MFGRYLTILAQREGASLVLMRGQRFRDDGNLHAAVRGGGLREPGHLRELRLPAERRRLELLVDPARCGIRIKHDRLDAVGRSLAGRLTTTVAAHEQAS